MNSLGGFPRGDDTLTLKSERQQKEKTYLQRRSYTRQFHPGEIEKGGAKQLCPLSHATQSRQGLVLQAT